MPPCNIPTPPTFACGRARFSPTWLVARVPQDSGDWLKQRSHRLEGMPQANATADLAACEQAAQPASL
eukprot:5155847-Prymnesium_polylepis.1